MLDANLPHSRYRFQSKNRRFAAARHVKIRPKGQDRIHPQNIKMAALMITVLPIVAIYPFVQRYFIHGQFVGAVKG